MIYEKFDTRVSLDDLVDGRLEKWGIGVDVYNDSAFLKASRTGSSVWVKWDRKGYVVFPDDTPGEIQGAVTEAFLLGFPEPL